MATNLVLTGNANPDSILRSVDDYIKIDKHEDALEMVYAFIASKKTKSWSTDLEKLLKVNIDLALKLNRINLLEENLLIFKNMCQNHHCESLENIFNYYLDSLKKQMKGAQELVGKMDKVEEIFLEINEQDDAQSFYFNSLMSKEGKHKEVFKQKWRDYVDAFFTLIELTSKNKKLELIYCRITRRAIDEFLGYKSVSDFKNLNVLLKRHQKYNKNSTSSNSLDLKNIETNHYLLGLRLYQLDIAKSFSLNQDAFYIIEDINYLLFCVKGKAKDYLVYYENLAEVFFKGGFYYLHVYALLNRFYYLKKLNPTTEELKKSAAKIVLACLSVSPQSEEFWLSEQLFEQYKFLLPNSLMDRNTNTLYDDLKKYNVLEIADKEYNKLFDTLTGKLDVFDFSSNIEDTFKTIGAEYESYKTLIRENSVTAVLQLLSGYYENISFDELKDFTHFADFEKVKQIILLNLSNQKFNTYLNYDLEIVEFKNNQINFDNTFNHIEEYLDEIRELSYGLANKIDNRNNQTYKNEILERFRCYIEESKEIEEEEQMKIREDRLLAEFKVKEKAADKGKESQLRRDRAFKKEEERKMAIERKMLHVKKQKIKELLENNPSVEVLNRPLRTYVDDEIVQLDFDIFEGIDNEIKAQKIKKIDDNFNKRFNLYDFLRRKVLAHELEQINAFNDKNKVNFNEKLNERVKNEEAFEEKKKKIIGASSLVDRFMQNIKKDRENVYRNQLNEYKEELTMEFEESIFSEALNKYKKKVEEESAKMTERGKNFKRDDEKERAPVITKLDRRGADFNKKKETKPETSGLQRGTGLIQKGTGILQRGTGGLQRGTGGLQRGTGNIQKETTMPQRGTGMMQRGTGFTQQKAPQKTAPTTGLAKRGQGFSNTGTKGFGNTAPTNKPTMERKPMTGTTKPQMKLTKGGGTLKREAPKKEAPKKEMPKRRGFGS